MTTLADSLYWKDEEIYLDGYAFLNCRFDNCVLITHRQALPNMTGCVLGKGTVLVDEERKIIFRG